MRRHVGGVGGAGQTTAQRSAPPRPRDRLTAAALRNIIRALPGAEEGMSYGKPAFKIRGRFLARFRDEDTVLAVKLGSFADRDVLMGIDAHAFFTTDHYRDHPTVLIRIAEAPAAVVVTTLEEAARAARARPAVRVRTPTRPRRA